MKGILRYSTQFLALVVLLASFGCGSARFVLGEVSASPPEAKAGELVTISIPVSNAGDAEGTYALTLIVDGAVQETKDITLNAGQTQNVAFSIRKMSVGTYAIDINGKAAQFTVRSTPPPPPTDKLKEQQQLADKAKRDFYYSLAKLYDDMAEQELELARETGEKAFHAPSPAWMDYWETSLKHSRNAEAYRRQARDYRSKAKRASQ
ncbi:MAG: hypothetical protein HYX80_06645 [Chloroflexi bacterium]|nr:hypothetical protein [Chloroflexota bacterium]